MDRIAFIIALEAEVEYAGSIDGCPIYFSGVGKVNASIAAHKAYSDGYTYLINIGSCGSLNYVPGDIVEVSHVFQDIDCTPLSEYGTTFGTEEGKFISLNDKTNVTCFTTDYFYDKAQHSKYSSNYLDMIEKCSIFDMECYSLAKVCRALNIKFASYKWISDEGNAEHWATGCHIGFLKIKQLLKTNGITRNFQQA